VSLNGHAPDPGLAATLDEYVTHLRRLRVWAGSPSVTALTDRVQELYQAMGRPPSEWPARTTVWDCFRLGRRRPNQELLTAVVEALVGGDLATVERWRQVLQVVLGQAEAASHVTAAAQLPASGGFVGRSDLLRQFAGRLDATSGPGICVIEGMAGVGKTALAVRLGHLIRDAGRAGGGVLFVNLRGFDPVHPPSDPSAVLGSLLRLRGVAGDQIPYTPRERGELYRRLLARTATLVVLDNAADEEQVAQLLPRSTTCFTVVTSRHRLGGLGPVERMTLEVFSPAEALELLRQTAGADRIDADPTAAGQIAERVGHLPLALAVVADHLRDNPQWTLSDYPPALSALALEGGVRSALALSERALPDDAARLLRLLALHPGADFDPHAAAALLDVTVEVARGLLGLLLRAHLLQRRDAADRFDFHDLVKAFAGDRVVVAEPVSQSTPALARLLRFYRHGAAMSVDVLIPGEADQRPRPEPADGAGLSIRDPVAASDWLDRESANLVAVATAAAHRLPSVTTDLSTILWRYLDQTGRDDHACALHAEALRAARATGDHEAQARALHSLGTVYWRQARHHVAIRLHRQAVALFHAMGDAVAAGRELGNIGNAYLALHRHELALRYFRRALAVFRATGNPVGESNVAYSFAVLEFRRGRYRAALVHCRQTLSLCRESGNLNSEALASALLGHILITDGRLSEASDHLRLAVDMFEKLGNRAASVFVLDGQAEIDRRLGHPERAIARYHEALSLAREMGRSSVEPTVLNGLGRACCDAGDLRAALDHHSAALAFAVRSGEIRERARALRGLARIHHVAGRVRTARLRRLMACAVGGTGCHRWTVVRSRPLQAGPA
jgi:tetratricopeptide (TPR) repeat protein